MDTQGDRNAKQIIEEWMLAVSQNGIERFDDLHIDRIDENWRSRQLWVQGAMDAFQIAVRLRNEHQLPFKVVLGFSLRAIGKKIGVDFRTQDQFDDCLNSTPPSLYLRPRTDYKLEHERAIKEGIVDADAVVADLDDMNVLSPLEAGTRCLYLEFKRAGDTEYCRSVLLEG
jgi:hypothetical protein